MYKLLTIAIPTFKRAAQLDRQLAWLARSVAGVGALCEVIVSDNCSPDETPAVCAKWSPVLSSLGVQMRVSRNSRNVGPLRNIARCIELSRSRFTWVIGDDDEIDRDTLWFIINQLQDYPDLASIVLNFRGRGSTNYDNCFTFDADQHDDGVNVIGQCLEQAYFGLAFMSAQVYRTTYAQAALRAWPRGTRNYDFQVFVSAFAGRMGRTLATRATHLTYITGHSVYDQNKQIGMQLYADSVEVFVQLARAGFDGALCRRLALRHLWELKRRFAMRTLDNSPTVTARTVARIAQYLVQLQAMRLLPPPQPPELDPNTTLTLAP